MSEWQEITLGEFVSLQRGHDLTDPERRIGKVPVMGSAGQNGFHDTALAKGPGVVIGRSGASFGQVHFSEKDYWPHNTCLYVTDFHGNDPRFAYYFLSSINFAGYNSGSAQPSLNRNFIYPIEIRVPSPDTQREIARVLGAIDDKIELNRRMNETLEAMARAIFQSWFVDFDPVRAKASGESADSICQRLGLTPELLALFPDSFADSELGEIPAGWGVTSLEEFCELNAKSWSTKTLPDEVHYVDLANTKNGVIQEVQTLTKSDAPSRAKRVLRTGDTVIGTVRPGNRSFAFIGERDAQMTGSTGFAVLSPKEVYLAEFVYLVSTAEDNIDRLRATNKTMSSPNT